jgi:hypothetical protein
MNHDDFTSPVLHHDIQPGDSQVHRAVGHFIDDVAGGKGCRSEAGPGGWPCTGAD